LPKFTRNSLPTVIHEFCHSYANPFIDRHQAELKDAGESLYAHVAGRVRSMAYVNAQTMLYESLVRVCVIRYRRQYEGKAADWHAIQAEKQNGFRWMQEMSDLMGEYEAHREQYPTLDDFSPRLVALFAETAKNYPKNYPTMDWRMSLSGQSIIACWIAGLVYWAISARSGKAVAERQSWMRTLSHKSFILFGYILLFWPRPPSPLDIILTPGTALTGLFGATGCFLGLLLTIWSRKALASNWSSEVVFKEGHELVQRGPYRFVRLPIYSGILLMALGTAICVGYFSSALGLLMLFAGFWIKLRQEELLLARHFPNQYPSYRVRTKALVPFIL
jgi:protein-S-isoprenylcysteine O-methyltransferase Ste14